MAWGDHCHRWWQRHKQHLGALAAVLGLMASATAQTTPQEPKLPEAAPSCADITLALARAPLDNAPPLEGHLSRCQKDADFLATLGQRMNRLGRHSEAAEHLERALLLDPARQDVQMAYAFALVGLGQASSARGFLQDLLKDQSLPADLRAQIQRQENALAELDTGAAAAAP